MTPEMWREFAWQCLVALVVVSAVTLLLAFVLVAGSP